MPIYEFRCPACDHVFEELVFKRSEIDELACPSCGARQVKQMMSSFSSTSNSSAGTAASSSCGPGSFS